MLKSQRWETDPSFPQAISSALDSVMEKLRAVTFFFFSTTMSSDSKPGWPKQPSVQPTANQYYCRLLLLSDNLSTMFCFNRGRSRDFRLLTQIRRFVSICLACNISISIRWIPSEFNSREHDNAYDQESRKPPRFNGKQLQLGKITFRDQVSQPLVKTCRRVKNLRSRGITQKRRSLRY